MGCDEKFVEILSNARARRIGGRYSSLAFCALPGVLVKLTGLTAGVARSTASLLLGIVLSSAARVVLLPKEIAILTAIAICSIVVGTSLAGGHVALTTDSVPTGYYAVVDAWG